MLTTETIKLESVEDVVEAVRDAYSRDTALYPVGGGTSLDFGLPAKREGLALDMTGLNRVIDYPARDMTITVEAGMTMKALAEALQAEGQFFPVDVPQWEQATLGGVVATGFNGPRRYGYGGIRDYIIGISAVDGHARLFKGGGRVVKNVAGYDFCKLLTGSLGTLGIITQLTLKLKPAPQRSALALCRLESLEEAERALAALVHSQTSPSAIELLSGPFWDTDPAVGPLSPGSLVLAVGLEGTPREVDWMIGQVQAEWRELGLEQHRALDGQEAGELWRRLAEFPAAASPPLVIKASLLPSGTTAFIQALWQISPEISVQAHAGNGVIIGSFPEFPAEGLSRTLVSRLLPVATAARGNVLVLSNPAATEMTHLAAWGGIHAPYHIMTAIKQQFDPKDLLNPGRFVYA